MATWTISFAISGDGVATVEADSEEEAIQAFRDGKGEDIELVEWDVNSQSYRGGYIEAILDE